MESKKILIGVPSNRQDGKFLDSLNNLISQLEGKHQISLLIEKWQHLPEAQNHIADYFLSRDFDYLLFLDDDHWGHTADMVDCLINANADMATMKTYVRHYPYPCALFKLNENNEFSNRYVGVEAVQYEKVDMTGFPMTLLSNKIFKVLERPYFRGVLSDGRDWATDVDFCERLREKGIRPVGCFQYCLPHGDITQENVIEMRLKNTKSYADRLRAKFQGV